MVENCSSGGLRFDLGILAHTHTTWLSDCTLPKPSVQLAYGSTLEFTPQVCNHWMVGDDEGGHVLPASSPGWWQFMFRVPMNGQYGISSRVFDWSEPLLQCAAENVALYKRLRGDDRRRRLLSSHAAPGRRKPERLDGPAIRRARRQAERYDGLSAGREPTNADVPFAGARAGNGVSAATGWRAKGVLSGAKLASTVLRSASPTPGGLRCWNSNRRRQGRLRRLEAHDGRRWGFGSSPYGK